MKIITKQHVIMGIIRCGEREPNRIGLRGRLSNANLFDGRPCTDHCVMGQFLHDLGCCDFKNAVLNDPDGSAHEIWFEAVQLNNAGVRWGEIPKQLGLVPGESPAEPSPSVAELPAEVPVAAPAEEPALVPATL